MKITEINVDARKHNPARREFEVTAATRRDWLALTSAIHFTGWSPPVTWEHSHNPIDHKGHRDTFVIFGGEDPAEKFALALKVAKREAKRPPPCPFCKARILDDADRGDDGGVYCGECGEDTTNHPYPIGYDGVMREHLKAGRLAR